MKRSAAFWLAAGWIGYAILPWYLSEGGGPFFFWMTSGYPMGAAGSGLALGLFGGKWWLGPIVLPLLLAPLCLRWQPDDIRSANLLVFTGLLGLLLTFGQGFALDHRGWTLTWLAALFGEGPRQFGMGYGALATELAFLMLFTHGLAGRGVCRGDAFTVSAIGLVIGLIALFVFYPIAIILVSALQDNAGQWMPSLFLGKFLDRSVWGLGCLQENVSCGVAWNTVFLAIIVGVGSTVLGLAFALISTRTDLQFRGLQRVLALLPIITPPFVIGLAVIMLFGRAGAVTALMDDWFGIPPSRWIYGLPGLFLSQMLAFTPISYLVLMGVVQGVSPSLEEASQTLRASYWKTFSTVTFPLLRPGLANAFLLGFVESIADFGNPFVLGGNYDVLSTKIFFAVVGAAHDQGRAAVLAIILLGFTLGAFYAQHHWLGRKSYTTVTGKGDSGLNVPLPKRVRWFCYGAVIPWAALTLLIYGTIFYGSVVVNMGRNYTLTFRHYISAFAIDTSGATWRFSGGAWNSFWTTLEVAVISAPLTAIIGLLTAYLLTRQRFVGQRSFEFAAMLSFAIPGTVVGISYILAFNVPPIEITGTGLILVICFVFRNMPVGVRAGVATMSQIDKSLDEASLTLGASSYTTAMRVIMPLLRPAIVAALTYSFVRAMTAVSAVIFLVSAEYNMSTSYIVNRVEAGEFGIAIAYSAALVFVMLAVVLLISWAVGERRLGRRAANVVLHGAG
jgi:iron(III) transport system permease protein